MQTAFVGRKSPIFHPLGIVTVQKPIRCIRRIQFQATASSFPFENAASTGLSPGLSGIHSAPISSSAPLHNATSKPSLLEQSLNKHSQNPQICYSTAAGGGDIGSTGGGGGEGGGGGSNGNNNGNGGDGDGEEEEFLDLQQAKEIAAAKGIELPEDFAAAASSGGLRASVLSSYTSIVGGGMLTGALARSLPAFRDRLIADRLYFFKVLAEVTIDSACATVAEVRKRGEEFWDEFEFYLSDLFVGLVLDVVLVTLLAPVAVAGRAPKTSNATGIRAWANKLPSAMFERSVARKYSVRDRLGCYFVRGLEYSLAGMACGAIGQGVASGMMQLKRQYVGHKEDDVAVPPVLTTALVWGLFMGLSSNTRYQIVFGLERIVDETIARNIPQVAYLTTTAIRFVNNVIGGEQFIDMARWAKIQ